MVQSVNKANASPTLSHLNAKGEANMVDVTEKTISARTASAHGFIRMSTQAMDLINRGENKKGDIFAIARIAGIQAAKKCSDLIPLCHPLMLTKVQVDFELDSENNTIKVISLCKLAGQTGVEMEALTAVSVALLTLFDMCKAADPNMEIFAIRVISKQGGKSGAWHAPKQGKQEPQITPKKSCNDND
jgi:cyclic pyranopterin phosphate synthase